MAIPRGVAPPLQQRGIPSPRKFWDILCYDLIGTLYACSKARWSLFARANASFFSLASSLLSHGDT